MRSARLVVQDFLAAKDAESYANLVEEAKKEAERLGLDYIAPEPLKPRDFDVPAGVDPYWVTKSGSLVSPSTPGAILEYFRKDSPPRYQEIQQQEDAEIDYWNSSDL